MRILVALCILFSASFASAQQSEVYIVKKGEVWDWHDVLEKSPHYRKGAGIGLPDLVARLNDSPKLRPGTQIRLAPLAKMLGETTMFSEWPEAKVLLDARTYALKWLNASCSQGYLSRDLVSPHNEAKDLRLRVDKLVNAVPRRAAAQVRALSNLLKSPRTNRARSPFQAAATCKNYIGILNRSGWALGELHKKLPAAS